MDGKGCAVLVILVAFMIVGFIFVVVREGERLGFCKGKGYDGLKTIDGELCCYRGEDGSFVAVPISVLKGE